MSGWLLCATSDDVIRVVIRHEIELDAMLQVRLATRQRQGEAAHRIDGLLNLFVVGAGKPGRRDRDESRVVAPG